MTFYKIINFPNREKQIPAIPYFLFLLHAWYILGYKDQGPLLLTWFNFNPSMDK